MKITEILVIIGLSFLGLGGVAQFTKFKKYGEVLIYLAMVCMGVSMLLRELGVENYWACCDGNKTICEEGKPCKDPSAETCERSGAGSYCGTPKDGKWPGKCYGDDAPCKPKNDSQESNISALSTPDDSGHGADYLQCMADIRNEHSTVGCCGISPEASKVAEKNNPELKPKGCVSFMDSENRYQPYDSDFWHPQPCPESETIDKLCMEMKTIEKCQYPSAGPEFRNKGLTSGGNKYFEFDCPSPGATSTGGFQDYCGGLPMDPFSNPKPFPNGATLCKWRPGWTPPPDKRA